MSVRGNHNAMATKRVSVNTPPLPPIRHLLNGNAPTAAARRHSSESSPQSNCTFLKNDVSTPDCFKPIHIATPMSSSKKLRPSYETSAESDTLNVFEENTSIVVAVRVRPLTQREAEDTNIKNVVYVDDATVTVSSDVKTPRNQFTFDHCFWSSDKLHLQYADQQKVYETVAQPLLDKAFEGYNTCLFAYGQTGSGKSYSIMGHQNWQEGIIPRFGQDLFERIRYIKDNVEKICVEISYFEIYNEKIHDLLASSTEQIKKAPMRVREHPVLGPYVVDLSTFVVTCYDDLAGWLSLGNKQRATASTGMNDKSSRSHSVFTIVVTQTEIELIDGEVHEHSRKSKINIVDLAGSERINISKTSGIRTKEGVSINKSLLTLGKVISQLAETSLAGNRKKVFIPYRESVLTWLLKESLGGNSKTTMLATISPASNHIEETLSTLRYAHQARNIVNVARINEDPKAKLIRELRAEIERLRGQQSFVEVPVKSEVAQEEINSLRERLRETERLLEQLTKSWQDKLQQATKCKAEEAEHLEKVGVSSRINNHLPNLVNLNEDPQLSETLLYLLSEGETRVGRMHLDSSQNIQLQGSLILDCHCTIKNVNNVVTIIPNQDGQTFVNGHLITGPTPLYHADRVVLGGEHFFRFNNPLEVQHEPHQNISSKDFIYAKKELLDVQEAQMKIALQKERDRTRMEMLEEMETIKKGAETELGLQRREYEDQIRELNLALEQHLEIKQYEDKKHQLELKNKRLLHEMEIEKRHKIMDEAETDNLPKLETNFLQEIIDYFDQTDSVVVEKSMHSSQEIGLYELSLMIKEANQICEKLGNKITFMSQDRLTESGLEMIVKVQDASQNLKIEWSISKFQSKLDLLQQMAEGEDSELFDADDSWKKDEHLPLTFSPKVLESFRKVYASNGQPSLVDSLNDSHIYKLTDAKDLEFGMDIAKLLKNLTDLYLYAMDLREIFTSRTQPVDGQQIFALKLTYHLSDLILQVSKVFTLYSYHIRRVDDASQLHERVNKNLSELYGKSFIKLGDTVTFVIQGIETNTISLIQESLSKMSNVLYQCSELTGRVTASLGIALRQEDSIKLEKAFEIGQNFIRGLETIVTSALKTALDTLECIELKLNLLADDSFFGTISDNQNAIAMSKELTNNMKEWTSKYYQLQVMTTESRIHCPESVASISIQSQHIIVQFSNIIEMMTNVYNSVKYFVRGEKLDLSEDSRSMSHFRELLECLLLPSYFYPEDSIDMSSHSDGEHEQLKVLRENVSAIITSYSLSLNIGEHLLQF